MIFITPLSDKYFTGAADIEQRSNPQPWPRQSIVDSCHQYKHLGIFNDYALIGYVLYQQAAEQADIIHLVVDKAEQGKGYAGQLLRYLIKQLAKQGVKTLFLEVSENNHRARAAYLDAGFIAVGRRKAYYKGKVDAIVMKNNLSHLRNG